APFRLRGRTHTRVLLASPLCGSSARERARARPRSGDFQRRTLRQSCVRILPATVFAISLLPRALRLLDCPWCDQLSAVAALARPRAALRQLVATAAEVRRMPDRLQAASGDHR